MGRRHQKSLTREERQTLYDAQRRAKKARREARAAMLQDFEARGKTVSQGFKDRVREDEALKLNTAWLPGDCPHISES